MGNQQVIPYLKYALISQPASSLGLYSKFLMEVSQRDSSDEILKNVIHRQQEAKMPLMRIPPV